MQYCANQRKKKKAIKKVIQGNLKNTSGLVKLCYGCTWFLRALAVILGLATIFYVAFLSEYLIDIAFLALTFGIPYGWSFVSEIVYIIAAGGEYRLRMKEIVVLSETGFMYSYHDARLQLAGGMVTVNVLYKDIRKYHYDEKTQVLTIYGKMIGNFYENGNLKSSDEYKEVSLLDVYDISLTKLLEEKC